MKIEIRKVQAVVPTASMADIAFLLIIYFMLTTSFSPVKMSVDLAEAANRAEVEKQAAVIAIGIEGQLEVSDGLAPGNRLNSVDELDGFVKEVMTVDPTKQFIIKADRNVRYDTFNTVYERLRTHGARRIALLTETKKGTAQ
jgi:biopolymer transport protein ExbD